MLDRVTLARVHMLGGVSNYVRQREGARFGLPEERRRTLYNGVDTLRFKPPAEEEPGLRLFTVAYFQKHKGVHHLLDAFARVRVPCATLTIAGDGPEAENLREQARALGISDRVSFIGLRDDLEQLLPRADVFVHNSHVEAFGLCIAEAMACGRAVIASKVGGVPELVEDGQSGLLVPPGDVGALAGAIERLLGDVALRQRLGENARARIVQRFGLRRSAVEHLTWCEEAFAERSRFHRAVRGEAARSDVLRIPQQGPAVPRPSVEVPLGPSPESAPRAEENTVILDQPL
jgi:glycosyltransferase involved in cell wall biosynthesis